MPKFAASTFFLSYEVLSFKLSIKKNFVCGFFFKRRKEINFRLRFFKRKYMFFFRSFYSNKRIRELNNQKFQNLDT